MADRNTQTTVQPDSELLRSLRAEAEAIRRSVQTLQRIALDAVLEATEAGWLDAAALRRIEEVQR